MNSAPKSLLRRNPSRWYHRLRLRRLNLQHPTRQHRFQADRQKSNLSSHLDEQRLHRRRTIRLGSESPKRPPAFPENYHLEVRALLLFAIPIEK